MLRERRREMSVPLLLGAVAFTLAFVQRPGLTTADTKINLHVDPGRFLGDVASMWTSTGQLGDVQAGQQTGYLFPMGPFFAVGHALGVPDWIVQRLWLGCLLALAAWGTVRLLDALWERPRGVAALGAGLVVILNPFVVTYVNRTTVTLLAYAALPWLLLAVHRGLRRPRGWAWPAAASLVIAASGGGINGAVTAWMLVGPLLLVVYEVLFAGVPVAAAWRFLLRSALLVVLTSLWWVIPAWIQSSYGIDFLHFTEQPGTVWGTTSITESLRLMSFWLSYVGIGFAGRAIPYFDDAHTLLFSAPVVVASLLLPAAALSGFVWTRRWRYGPFFLLLALVALLIMGAGFPEGTPLRHGLNFTYNHVAAVRFLRASYKAAPLLAIALAGLGGVGAECAVVRLRGSRHARLWITSGAVGALAVLALAAWPLVTGRAQDAQVSYRSIPSAWRQVAADLDRAVSPDSRAIVLPGNLFSFYRWGGTVDPVLPVLTRRRVAERTEVPYGDLRATDLLWTIDGLVHQQRLLPGELEPLLRLISASAVVTGTDSDPARSDAPPPADAARQLATLGPPVRRYGPSRVFAPTTLGPRVSLPQVRRYAVPGAPGIVRIEPRSDPILIDGSASGVAALASFGGLPTGRPLLYGGDLTPAQARDALRLGGEVVITDSNRRRAFVAGSLEQNTGPTLTPSENVTADGIVLDPFARGPDYETVAGYRGLASVQAPSSPQRPQYPEHAPYAAVDGSAATAWIADPTLGASRRVLQVTFTGPRDVAFVDLLPYDTPGARVRGVEIGGRRFALRAGWNHLSLGLRDVTSLQVALTDVTGPGAGAPDAAVGIRELRIPGITPVQYLRTPVDLARDLRGQDLGAVSLRYVFERTTGDDPFHRSPAPASAGDAEVTIRRQFEVPATRSFAATGWVSATAASSDPSLDRIAGYRGPVSATSSGRFDAIPGLRASAALDGDPATAWIGPFRPGAPAWLAWRTSRTSVIDTLRLLPAREPVRRPSIVRISWPGGSSPALAVAADGTVRLPRPVRTASLRIEVLAARAVTGATAAQRQAVGIAEIVGGPRVRASRSARLDTGCGAVTVQLGAALIRMRAIGSRASFDAGTPLTAAACGPPVTLSAGVHELVSLPGPLAVDELALNSPAPRPRATIAAGAGRVLDPGRTSRASVTHVRVEVRRDAWLVLGEGYNRGWEATCNSHSLGAPRPIDGYASGWPVTPGCRDVSFTFAPNRTALVGYAISALAGLACLALICVAVIRRRSRSRRAVERPTPAAPPQPVWVGDATGPRPWPPVRAVALSIAVGVVFGFVYGVTAGVLAVPVLALILWRGVDAGRLTLAAGGLLAIVVPVLYLAHPASSAGGNHYGYAAAHMAAHWAGVAAIGLLDVALARVLVGQWRQRPTATDAGASSAEDAPAAPVRAPASSS